MAENNRVASLLLAVPDPELGMGKPDDGYHCKQQLLGVVGLMGCSPYEDHFSTRTKSYMCGTHREYHTGNLNSWDTCMSRNIISGRARFSLVVQNVLEAPRVPGFQHPITTHWVRQSINHYIILAVTISKLCVDISVRIENMHVPTN